MWRRRHQRGKRKKWEKNQWKRGVSRNERWKGRVWREYRLRERELRMGLLRDSTSQPRMRSPDNPFGRDSAPATFHSDFSLSCSMHAPSKLEISSLSLARARSFSRVCCPTYCCFVGVDQWWGFWHEESYGLRSLVLTSRQPMDEKKPGHVTSSATPSNYVTGKKLGKMFN